jgi:hypothetical protein
MSEQAIHAQAVALGLTDKPDILDFIARNQATGISLKDLGQLLIDQDTADKVFHTAGSPLNV